MKSISMPLLRFGIFCFWTIAIGIFLVIPSIRSRFVHERSLSIFTWPLILDPIYLTRFEKETGIKLYITYFESSSALLNKLLANRGYGYDIIIPDDRSLELLIQHSLVKKIDMTKLDFFDAVNPFLLGTYADPYNHYSLPYYWGAYGIGYDMDRFKNTLPTSWSILFEKNLCASICMSDDPREAIMVTAQFLFGTIDALKNKDAREKVKKLLIDQKKQVEIYTVAPADSLLQNKSCGIATIMSPDMSRLMRGHDNFDIIFPKEGSFIVIDSIAIPSTSGKDDLIYQFINYLYRPEIVLHHITTFGYCSPLSSVQLPELEKLCPVDTFRSFDFFRNVISDDEINEIWIEVLAA